MTPTRVWEFAVGAMCALLVIDRSAWFRTRVVLGWLGLAAILVASYYYVTATPFPGYAALLPVLGAAAVIMAAQSSSPWSASWWLSRRPATMVGDISYAVYLWHWPLLVLIPLALGRELSFPIRLLILTATLVLSWLSTHLFETPLRHNAFLRTRRWPSLAMAVGGVSVMLVASSTASAIFDARVAAAAARFTGVVASEKPCQGAAVFDPGAHCPSVFGDGPIMAPALAIKDQGNPEYARCDTWLDKTEIHECDFGPEDSPVSVAVVGDSHALQWLGAVELLAKQGRWRVKTYFKTSCPLFANAIRVIPSEPKGWQQNCTEWQREVTTRLVDDKSIRYVLVTAYTHVYQLAPVDGGPTGITMEEAFRAAWKKITDTGKKVVVLETHRRR